MPEPTDIIVLEPGEEGWTYRYAARPDEVTQRLHGYTFCCNRAIAVPASMGHRVPTLNVPGNWPLIDDCCDRPFAVHGHKPVELPPYSGEHATCRKCGSKAVETKFATGGYDAADPYGINKRAGYPPEWLARRCAVCQAQWDEATASQPQPTEKPTSIEVARVVAQSWYDAAKRHPDDPKSLPIQEVAGHVLRALDGETNPASLGVLAEEWPWAVADEHTETVTSEPNAALYMTCPLRHPYALRTTTTIVGGERRKLHHELVCPTCEADGTTGLIAVGGIDG